MTLEASYALASPWIQSTSSRRINDDDSWREAKRWKRVSHEEEDEYAAASSLVFLARGGGGATTTAAEKQKGPSPSHVDPSPSKNNCYNCGVCGRTFSSYQALGGHKTSHRSKSPGILTLSASAVTTETSNCTSRQDLKPIFRLHKCTICRKIFPTGQALGGHKRKHYEGVIRKHGGSRSGINYSEDGSGASGVTSTGSGAGDDVMTPIPLNFDLNLPPPPELDLRLHC